MGEVHRIEAKVDAVFHVLASEPPGLDSLTRLSVGTLNLLRIAHVKGATFVLVVPKDAFVYSGSEDVSGRFPTGVRFAISLSYTFGEERGVDVRVAQLFDVYGPGGVDGFNSILLKLLNGSKVVFPRGPTYLCHVEDAIRALMGLTEGTAKKAHVASAKVDGPDVVKMARRIAGSSSELIFVKSRELELPNLTEGDLAISPSIGLEEGLRQTISWLRANGDRFGRARGTGGEDHEVQPLPKAC